MACSIPLDFRWAVLQPIGKGHIAVSKIYGICPAMLRRYRILLRKYQTHDLAQFDVVDEELDMHWIRWMFGRAVGFVVNKIILTDHLNV